MQKKLEEISWLTEISWTFRLFSCTGQQSGKCCADEERTNKQKTHPKKLLFNYLTLAPHTEE